MWQSHISIDGESGYGLGWVSTNLPSKGGLVGLNAYKADAMPIIGKGIKLERRMIYHQGSANGALSAVYLLPESETAIVVLSNSLDLCDTPDWVAQLLVETILDCPEHNNFIELARKTSANAISHIPAMNRRLADERVHNTPMKPLASFVGRYSNTIGNFVLDVTIHQGELRLTVQEFKYIFYDLYHYHHDVFAWKEDRDAETKKAMFPMWAIGFHKIIFSDNKDGIVTSLNWAYDKNILHGEQFFKSDQNQKEKL